MRKTIVAVLFLFPVLIFSQNRMTPELLWKLVRVSGLGISKDGKYIVYSVSTPDMQVNKSKRKSFLIPIEGGIQRDQRSRQFTGK
jgi:hypothetical protein